MIEKPLLSGKAPADLQQLTFPVIASPKLDGIRCLTLPANDCISRCRAVSRTLKSIPNHHVRQWIEANLPPGVDGELLLPKWTEPFREVSSAIMSRDGEPDFSYAVFDYVVEAPSRTFEHRLRDILTLPGINKGPLKVVQHRKIGDAYALQEFMVECLEWGFEGVMVRDPNGPYKFGRSTTREGILLKIKNFEDEEAIVVGMVEQMHNENEQERDHLGHAKRSTAKAGLVPAGTMGALVCQFDDGTEFEVGTGFTQEQRQEIWDSVSFDHEAGCMQHDAIGCFAKIKHQPDPGGRQPGQKPRFPVFLGWRED